MRIMFAHVAADIFQLFFRAQRAEIRDLRLEGAGQVGRGVDDARAKGGDSIRQIAQFGRQFRQVGIESHAQQGIIGRPCGG